LQDETAGLASHLWSFVGGRPIVNRWTEMKQVPATSPESDALSKDLKKRGFRFVGSTILYAHMQATGMVNDHVVSCFRHAECKKLR
jgi:DNA-3-methyladenine glycosylase I